MSEWEAIRITHHDKERSESPKPEDSELSRQVFALSSMPPPRWVEICNSILSTEPGRLGREARVTGQALTVWGGPKTFDQRDANHLKKLVDYANEFYQEMLQPADLSGFEAFG